MSSDSIPWDFALILALLATLVPWRGAVRMKRLLKKSDLSSADRLSLYCSTILFQWIIVGVVAWRAAARGLSAAELALSAGPGVRAVLAAWPKEDAGWRIAGATVLMTGLLCATQIFSLKRIAALPPDKRGTLFAITEKIMPRSRSQTWLFVALAFTAGIAEEFLYRGFVFAVWARMFAGGPFPSGQVALALSSLWFAVAHFYQGERGIISTFVVGAIFCSARIWTGSLIPPIVAHIGVDLTAGLYASRLLRSA